MHSWLLFVCMYIYTHTYVYRGGCPPPCPSFLTAGGFGPLTWSPWGPVLGRDPVTRPPPPRVGAEPPGAETIPVAGGRLVLGQWQSVLLVDADGPRPRRVGVQLVGGG